MSPRNRKNEPTTTDADIKYNNRFRAPTKDQILKALKTSSSSTRKRLAGTKYDAQFEKLLGYFDELPKPKSHSDWLVQFNECGQTCDQFVRTCPTSATVSILGKRRFIYFVQIGEFTETQLKFDNLIEYSKCFFSSAVIRQLPMKIDVKLIKKANRVYDLCASYGDMTRKLKYRYENKRLQILAQSLHKFLYAIKPDDASCLVGFCEYDLFAEESDLFVAGLCDGDLRVAAFSCFRYDPRLKYCDENWFDVKLIKKKQQQQQNSNANTVGKSDVTRSATLLLVRSCKLLVHETCHLLGMEHCIYLNCCMNGSGHLEEDFGQSMFLCPIDLKKLSLIINFDLINRYKSMKAFFDQHNAVDESEWLAKVILALENNHN